jgi:RNA polymerase sigma factor (TIGR02999 family)
MGIEPDRSEVTRLLEGVGQGDPQAARELLPVLYDELRRLAAQRLAHEAPGQTIEATALVHEAYLRLVGSDPDRPWNGRGHFFAAAAEAMRRILIENARRKRRMRHGGGLERIDLDQIDLAADRASDNLLALDLALDRLEAEHPVVALVVKLRYFAGLPIEEAAAVLGISVRTANRHWAFARAWLYQQLCPPGESSL